MSKARAIDIGVALAAFALTLALFAGGGVGPEERDHRDPDAIGVLLAALSTLPLVFARRSPLAVYVFVVIANAVMNAMEYPQGPPFGAAAALFYIALKRPELRISGRALGALIVSLFLAHFVALGVATGDFPAVELLLGSSLWTAVWFVGDRVRMRRDRIVELEERALRAEREAERERRLAAAEERTRIARDLHDSAGHAINVILVHAGAARLHAERDPERAREALRTIEEVAGETLREIDQLVSALRENGERAETPIGLAALDVLVQRHRNAGLEVDVRVDGAARPLSPAVDQAAYRILQESLTNALRHGDGTAEVALTYGADTLELDVTNPSRDGEPAAVGHGLVGMHERASLLGGSVSHESANGVFRMRARLPYAGEER